MNPAACVECGLHNPGPVCDCGHVTGALDGPGAEGDDSHQCAWVSYGRRCRYPATWTAATGGAGARWYCSHHTADCSPEAAETYVEASQDYRTPSPAQIEAAHLRHVRDWLREHGPEALRSPGASALTLARNPAPGRQWARRLLERAAAGEPLPALALQYAREAAADGERTRPHQNAQDAPIGADGMHPGQTPEIVDCGPSRGLPAACGEAS